MLRQPASDADDEQWRRAWRDVFFVWLIVFYVLWVLLIANYTNPLSVFSQWPVTVAMAGGSFVAGSTPVAGGTVGFPVLVYVSHQPPRLGKYFCVAIQSVGMLSASIYILMKKRTVNWQALLAGMAGAVCSIPYALIYVAPHLSDGFLKVLFAVIYGAFGLFHLIQMKGILGNRQNSFQFGWAGLSLFFLAGLIGGTLTSFLGVGADIVLYGALVLIYRCDIKQAIPTATMLMAFCSIVAISILAFMAQESAALSSALSETYVYWLAAAPIVVLGGPLGSMISRRVPRIILLSLVGFLCTFQCVWTCAIEQMGSWHIVGIMTAILLLNYAFHSLSAYNRWAKPGNNRKRRSG